jgi:hypothetical protein
MPSNQWSVQPEDVRVELVWTFDGTERPFWIQLKKYLTVGENKKMLKSISNVTSKIGVRGEQAPAPEARFEWTDYSFARCQAYLLDWSLSDDDGNKMGIARDTLESLHQEVFDLIDNAIDKHEATIVNATSKKKAATGGRKRKTISRS